MPRRFPPRLSTFDYRGRYRYFVTCCVFRRRAAFSDPTTVSRLNVQLLQTAAERAFAVPAYVFMPDHLHVLMEGISEDANLRSMMTLLRQRLALSSTTRPLWQRGYFERVLRTDEQTLVVAQYIIANPIRAGLVASAFDYPFSFSIEHGKEFRPV
jgi:putative transposase